MTTRIVHGDCIEVMAGMEPGSIDAVVTDPPYGLQFMGREWDRLWRNNTEADQAYVERTRGKLTSRARKLPDYSATKPEQMQEWHHQWAVETLRLLKPGGHMLTFGSTRTHHRLMCAIEDAGFEIRDTILWVFATGFPKSLNISVQIDSQERDRWLKISKALDNLAESDILKLWITNSKTAKFVGVTFLKSGTGIGINTLKRDSALIHVTASANNAQSRADVIIAELNTYGAPHLWVVESIPSAPANVGVTTEVLSVRVTSVRSSPESLAAIPDTENSIALVNVQGLLNENMGGTIKAVEALKIWLGRTKSSNVEDTSALCVALTDDLKRIILSRSKTFQSLDTTCQMECVSAMIVTITESMAEHLISFTVDILRNRAIDKAAGAEREVLGSRSKRGAFGGVAYAQDKWTLGQANKPLELSITAPATDAAREWDGWGTALKPAVEYIVLARKPLDGTIVQNVLRHGVGGLNIDACRVVIDDADVSGFRKGTYVEHNAVRSGVDVKVEGSQYRKDQHPQGRWPANLIHDGSDEAVAGFPQTQSGRSKQEHAAYAGESVTGLLRGRSSPENQYDDSGSSARYFYCAKASRAEREEGLEALESVTGAEAVGREEGAAGTKSPRAGAGRTRAQVRNDHPTVKPLALMRYLVRLITPPDGVILDPFCGSGSTLVAAIQEGMRPVGIDIDEKYCQIAWERVLHAIKEADSLT